MYSLVLSFIEFIRVRQLNFALAALLTCGYLLYQYWGTLFEVKPNELEECPHSNHNLRAHSRSRSRSRASHHERTDMKHGRARRVYGRCSDCSECSFEATKFCHD